MWIFELLAGLIGAGMPGSTRNSGASLSPAQNVATGVGTVALPVIGFILVLFTGLWEHPFIALVLLPAGFVLLTAALSARLGNDASWTLRVAVLAAVGCVTSCAIALLLGAMAGFYRDF